MIAIFNVLFDTFQKDCLLKPTSSTTVKAKKHDYCNKTMKGPQAGIPTRVVGSTTTGPLGAVEVL